MRRWRTGIWNAIAGVGLVVSLAVAILCVRSRHTRDLLYHDAFDGSWGSWQLESDSGAVAFYFSFTKWSHRHPGVNAAHVPHDEIIPLPEPDELTWWNFHLLWPWWGFPPDVTVPHWFLCVLAASPALGRFARRRLRARRVRHLLVDGRCVHCGYDLRATPGRCPECGTVAATEAG